MKKMGERGIEIAVIRPDYLDNFLPKRTNPFPSPCLADFAVFLIFRFAFLTLTLRLDIFLLLFLLFGIDQSVL